MSDGGRSYAADLVARRGGDEEAGCSHLLVAPFEATSGPSEGAGTVVLDALSECTQRPPGALADGVVLVAAGPSDGRVGGGDWFGNEGWYRRRVGSRG
jgi:hypothetical protein